MALYTIVHTRQPCYPTYKPITKKECVHIILKMANITPLSVPKSFPFMACTSLHVWSNFPASLCTPELVHEGCLCNGFLLLIRLLAHSIYKPHRSLPIMTSLCTHWYSPVYSIHKDILCCLWAVGIEVCRGVWGQVPHMPLHFTLHRFLCMFTWVWVGKREGGKEIEKRG